MQLQSFSLYNILIAIVVNIAIIIINLIDIEKLVILKSCRYKNILTIQV